MSIYIKGMEMPKNCYSCDFGKFHSDGGQYCGRHMRSVNSGLSRPDWCPLVPVPPHGRLGDLDALYRKMFVGPDGQVYPNHDVDNWPHTMNFKEIKRFILAAPTIIQADDK